MEAAISANTFKLISSRGKEGEPSTYIFIEKPYKYYLFAIIVLLKEASYLLIVWKSGVKG